MRAILFCCAIASAASAQDFARADRSRTFAFPRDHGAHEAFGTEWWYFTGVLAGDARRFGYELTFFRVALTDSLPAGASPWRARDLILAHLALTDVAEQRFRSAERVRRAVADIAGAAADSLFLFAGDWRASTQGERFELVAGDAALGLRLSLLPSRSPVLHGESGLSVKDRARENASYYYSIPRLATTGELQLDGEVFAVVGDSWMDHEFFSGDTPAQGLGWDWFALHLSDGSDLMLYRVRHPRHDEFAFGSWMPADGSVRSLAIEDAQWRPLAHWQSAATGNRYPIEWEIHLPREGLRLRTRALVAAQEIDARRSVGFAYWEGLSDAELEWADRRLTGSGYVELTGYGSPP
jgi:predicted secreted hydrolase